MYHVPDLEPYSYELLGTIIALILSTDHIQLIDHNIKYKITSLLAITLNCKQNSTKCTKTQANRHD